MASKQKQTIDFGELPREGYVYSLYRGHIIRLGVVVLALMAVLAWAWSGSWTAVRSYLLPSPAADTAALAAQRLEILASDPGGETVSADRVEPDGLWVQGGSYRLRIRFDSVEPLEMRWGGAEVWLGRTEDGAFLVVSQSAPEPGEEYRAVFEPVPGQLAWYTGRTAAAAEPLSAWQADLRPVEVGYESSDTMQMLLFTPAVLALLIFWIVLLSDPRRHPIYRQLGKYGLTVAAVVASIDREVAAGELTVESSKVSTTRSWRMQRTAFTTLIYKNTTAPETPAGEGTTNE